MIFLNVDDAIQSLLTLMNLKIIKAGLANDENHRQENS